MAVAPERDLIRPLKSAGPLNGFFTGGGGVFPVTYRRSAKAKRYILSVRGDGTVIVTVPRGGSQRCAEEFLASRCDWVQRTLLRIPSHVPPKTWTVGSQILFRGELVKVEVDGAAGCPRIWLGTELLGACVRLENVRPEVESGFRRLAEQELPQRVRELAELHGSPVRRILIGNQRSRWGSCSCRGTVSLNWRLIQAPPHVRDYIILHELMHFREMNHSRRFWAHVEQVCPDYQHAEKWLSEHRYLLEPVEFHIM